MRRTVLGCAVVLTGVASTMLYGGRGHITPLPAIVPLLTGSVIVTGLLSGYILFAHARQSGSFRLSVLAAAYLLPGLVAVPYILTFPGVFAATGLFGATAQTAVYLWLLWHGGFPALVIAAVAVGSRRAGDRPDSRRMRITTAALVAACLAVAGVGAVLFIRLASRLPVLMDHGHFTGAAIAVALPAIVLLDIIALLAIFVQTVLRTKIALWVFIAVVASMLDTVLGVTGDRYSFGWYVGEMIMTIASTFMLTAFVVEIGHLHARVIRVNAALTLTHDRERLSSQERIAYLASHDQLTGAFDRAYIEEHLRKVVASAERDETRFAVVVLGIDRLKEINDAFGRAAGDSVIVEFANRVQNLLAVESRMGRLFSDEFAVITEEIGSADDAEAAAAEARQSLRRPHIFEGRPIELNASIGIALYPDDGASAEALLNAVDAAVNRAKFDGGNVMRMFSREFADEVRSRRLLYEDLSGALTREEFFLQYQPIVDLGSGELRMAEALLRWRSRDRGVVPPADFIPLAEESELMVLLGRWVIEETVRDAQRLRCDGSDVKIAVNVSARQLHDPGFFDHLSATVAAAGVVPADFELEVTETAAMADTSIAQDVLTRCRAAGFGIALDDFGTHFSSLTYLRRLPVDTVKIDRSFVHGLPSNEDDAAIVGGIISLVKGLGRRVVAEGVETPEQAAWLSRAGCETVQGYLYGRPMAFQELRAWRAPQLPQAV